MPVISSAESNVEPSSGTRAEKGGGRPKKRDGTRRKEGKKEKRKEKEEEGEPGRGLTCTFARAGRSFK